MTTKNEHNEIVLPQFPDAYFVLERTKTMVQDYAREAVRLDRKRRAEPKPWPQDEDECWITWSDGAIRCTYYIADLYAALLARNRVFRTEAEASAKDERDLVMAEWERAADWEKGDRWLPERFGGKWSAWNYYTAGRAFDAFASRESCEAFIKRMSKPDGTSRLDCLVR